MSEVSSPEPVLCPVPHRGGGQLLAVRSKAAVNGGRKSLVGVRDLFPLG